MLRLSEQTEPGRELTFQKAGVSIIYRVPSFAEYVAARSAGQAAMITAIAEHGDSGAEAQPYDINLVSAVGEEAAGDTLVEICAVSWSGVGNASGEPLELDGETWALFKVQAPVIADEFLQRLFRPHKFLEAEGNASPVGSNG